MNENLGQHAAGERKRAQGGGGGRGWRAGKGGVKRERESAPARASEPRKGRGIMFQDILVELLTGVVTYINTHSTEVVDV